ncbi:hypothetical protein [Nocardioides montaniterrae]
MSELTDLRDHARARLAWTPDLPMRAACKTYTAFGTPKPADHVNCGGCGCECHRPTAKEIRLWTQIAEEIDVYLTPAEKEGGLW